ncbi:MAG TPA: hypothetical protein VGJ00_07015 [Rhabdochlamydiaceae bacterium]|jgi:hypothetical protein
MSAIGLKHSEDSVNATKTMTPETWQFKEKQSSDLTISHFGNSQLTLQRLQKLSLGHLTFKNSIVTYDLMNTLIEKRIPNLRFEECTMRQGHADIFISGLQTQLVFKGCILTRGKEALARRSIHLGLLRIGNEIATFKPYFVEWLRDISVLSENLQTEIGAYSTTAPEKIKIVPKEELDREERYAKVKALSQKLCKRGNRLYETKKELPDLTGLSLVRINNFFMYRTKALVVYSAIENVLKIYESQKKVDDHLIESIEKANEQLEKAIVICRQEYNKFIGLR